MKFKLPPIYPITDKTLARSATHLGILKELARGGAQLVQIRDKSTSPRDLLKDLVQCVEFAHKKNITLIINDRCDLVLCCGAMGVHLGQEDLPPEAARALLGKSKIIGYSTHSLAQVHSALHLPVHYIGFGPIFPTSTKSLTVPIVGLQPLSRACKISPHPVVAIGGIGLHQIQDVLKAGAASVAVISALMQSENLALQMQRFLEQAMEK
jgi:thiamine-phosphate pyrophosphorylase